MRINRYRDLNTYFRELFGERVQKITVDAGLSCPNRDGSRGVGGCIYCGPRGSGTGMHASGLSITDQIRKSREKIASRYKASKFLIYFQSFSNTYAPLERLVDLYEEALVAIPGVVGLSIGTRPDCIPDGVIALLEYYARSHLIWVEYGLQSAHDDTLSAINRGHDFACFQNAVARTRNLNIRICVHVILGLPGEDRGDMIATARALADTAGIDGIKIHLLYVIKGTGLERLYRHGQYTPMEQDAYVDTVCEFLERLPPQMVIQRLTGDPHPHELVAPLWSLNKQETLSRIHSVRESRDT